MKTLWVVCPCYFDTESFSKVREGVKQAFPMMGLTGASLRFVLVDDSAGRDKAVSEIKAKFSDVEVVAPPYNLGSQAVIVYGLRSIRAQVAESDLVMTMDSDGEDKPEDTPKMVAALVREKDNLHKMALARRTYRQESLIFKAFYRCYTLFFRILSGTVIRSGNFAVFRGWFLKKVVFHPHFDQCYTSALISLPLQIEYVPLARGHRFFGQSKTGWMGLFSHGFRSLMPFTERVAVRGMLFSGIAMMGCLVATVALFLNAMRTLAFGALMTSVLFLLLFGMFGLLFATFSQTKARSLRALVEMPGGAENSQ